MTDTIKGYGSAVQWDGHTLRAAGTTKAAHFALVGKDGPAELVLTRGEMDSVEFKNASMVANGAITIRADGKKYILHFRRKDRDEFRGLAEDLGAEL